MFVRRYISIKEILNYIEQNDNAWLEIILNNCMREININDSFYETALKSNNFEAFTILCNYDTKKNFKTVLKNNPSILKFLFNNEEKLKHYQKTFFFISLQW